MYRIIPFDILRDSVALNIVYIVRTRAFEFMKLMRLSIDEPILSILQNAYFPFQEHNTVAYKVCQIIFYLK